MRIVLLVLCLTVFSALPAFAVSKNMEEGKKNYEKRKYKEATSYLQKEIEQNPGNMEAHRILVWILKEEKRDREAMEMAREAFIKGVQHKGQDKDIILYLDRDKVKEGIAFLENNAKINPQVSKNLGRNLVAWGKDSLVQGSYEVALQLFSAAVKHDSDLAPEIVALCVKQGDRLLLDTKNDASAIESCYQAGRKYVSEYRENDKDRRIIGYRFLRLALYRQNDQKSMARLETARQLLGHEAIGEIVSIKPVTVFERTFDINSPEVYNKDEGGIHAIAYGVTDIRIGDVITVEGREKDGSSSEVWVYARGDFQKTTNGVYNLTQEVAPKPGYFMNVALGNDNLDAQVTVKIERREIVSNFKELDKKIKGE